MPDLIQALAEQAAKATLEKTAQGWPPGMMGGMGGYPMGGMGMGYAGMRPALMGMGGYPMGGMGGYMGMRPGLMMPGMGPQYGMMGGMGNYGLGMPGIGLPSYGYGMPQGINLWHGFGATNADELRNLYETEYSNLERMASMTGMSSAEFDRRVDQLNRQTTQRLERMKMIQSRRGPESGRGAVALPPNFGADLRGQGGGGYLRGLSSAWAGGDSGGGPQSESERLAKQIRAAQQEVQGKTPLPAEIGNTALKRKLIELERLGKLTSTTGGHDVTVLGPDGEPISIGMGGRTLGMFSGQDWNSPEWRAFDKAQKEYEALQKQREEKTTEHGQIPVAQGQADIADLQKRRQEALAREQATYKQQGEEQELQSRLHQAQTRQRLMDVSKPFTPVTHLGAPGGTAVAAAPKTPATLTPGTYKFSSAEPSRFLQPYTIEELAEEAAGLEKQAINPLRLRNLLAGAAIAPVALGIGGSAIGGLTAPQEYAPEGAVRGGAMGLGAGLGMGGGALVGKGLGSLAGKMFMKPGAGRGLAGLIGTLLGMGVGGYAGGVAGHMRMPFKPWEAGVPSWLERADAAMRQRVPAPGFSPDYMTPATFMTSLPKTAAVRIALGHRRGQADDISIKNAAWGDDETMSDRSRAMLSQASKGSMLGTGAGAAIAALSAVLSGGRPKGAAELLTHALKWGVIGAPFGGAMGAGLGALNAYQTTKGGASETRRVHNGMVPDQKRKKKSAPMFENMDELMHDLARGRK
jgi:hypothetical protein